MIPVDEKHRSGDQRRSIRGHVIVSLIWFCFATLMFLYYKFVPVRLGGSSD
jgi:hypothetical protein